MRMWLEKQSRTAGLTLLFGCAGVLLPGCNKDKAHVSEAPATATVTATPRPDALTQAIAEIKAGQAPEAQSRVQAFLDSDSDSPYRAEAFYLLGQSLAAQDKFEEAKSVLDEAVSKADDRTLKALAMLGRADCNLALRRFGLASRQYHWLETMYRDVRALPQDEVLYKLGYSTKQAGFGGAADHWFNQVIELYATGPYVEKARGEHSKFNPSDPDPTKQFYTLQVDAFSKEEYALEEAKVLSDKGYRDVDVFKTLRNNKVVYEVRVGRFNNQTEALRAQTDAELAGLPATITTARTEP